MYTHTGRLTATMSIAIKYWNGSEVYIRRTCDQHTHTYRPYIRVWHIYIYIYIYIDQHTHTCVCVCMCAWNGSEVYIRRTCDEHSESPEGPWRAQRRA
jgi:hypothetical protein